MPTIDGWISIAIVATTLALLLIRPRNMNEALAAVLGALAVVLTGGVAFGDLPDLVGETADVLIFLAAMMILTVIVEQAGVFDVVAEYCANLARGSGTLLFVIIFLFGALVTAFLSLDVTVIVLTPIIYAITTRRRIDPLPFLFGCTFVANTASLIFPMSNLTNLLVYSQLDISFGQFVADLWLPNLVAALTNLLVFLWIFRSRIPRHYDATPNDALPARDWWFNLAAIVLVLTLGGLIGLGLSHQPLSIAAVTGAAALLLCGLATRRIRLRAVSAEVTWPVLAFVVGMLIVVRGLELQWLDSINLNLPSSPIPAIAAGVGITALGSNLVNNVPMALLAMPAVERAPVSTRDLLAYATLVGCNIGPTLTTYGSLATMLWLSLIRRRGIIVTTGQYILIGLVTTPIVLVTTSIALWLSTR